MTDSGDTFEVSSDITLTTNGESGRMFEIWARHALPGRLYESGLASVVQDQDFDSFQRKFSTQDQDILNLARKALSSLVPTGFPKEFLGFTELESDFWGHCVGHDFLFAKTQLFFRVGRLSSDLASPSLTKTTGRLSDASKMEGANRYVLFEVTVSTRVERLREKIFQLERLLAFAQARQQHDVPLEPKNILTFVEVAGWVVIEKSLVEQLTSLVHEHEAAIPRLTALRCANRLFASVSPHPISVIKAEAERLVREAEIRAQEAEKRAEQHQQARMEAEQARMEAEQARMEAEKKIEQQKQDIAELERKLRELTATSGTGSNAP